MALNSQSSSQLSSISSHFRNPKAPSAANFFMKLASSSDESSKPSVRIAAGAESTPNARFSARRRESVSVQQLERPLMEYMSLPASQYPVLDAERIERIDDRTFKCYTKKLHHSVSVLPDQAARALPLMSATSLARNFPTSVLLQEQRDENRACLQTIKEDKASQVTLERRQMETRFSEQEENNDIHSEIRLKDFHHQLLNMRGSWYPLPSFQTGETTMSSVASASGHTKTKKLKDVEPCKVLALAKKALSASKQAVLLSEDSHSPEADVKESLIRDSRSIDFIDCPLEDKIVRSKRLLEKRSRRRESKLKFMVEEAGIPKRLDLRKKKSEPYDPNDPLRLFLRGAETTRLLTAKEESVLVAAIQDLMRSEEVKSRLEAQFDREPTLVEWAAALGVSCRELKAQLHSGNSSREKLIHANFRLVVHIAKQYQGKGLSLQDLMQEGSTGLMRSVEKFKPQAGCRFASYAYWWIRQSVRRAIFHHSRTIRLPDNVYTLLYKVTEAKRLCIQDGNHQPTQEDIASRVGITVEKLDKLLFTARMPISMQQTIWSDQDTTFQVTLERRQMETRFSEQEENNDIHSEIRLKDFHHQLLNMRGSWYPLPSFQTGETTMSSVASASGHTKTKKLKDVEPCKVLALAKKALSASKQAVLLSEDSHSPEADVKESLIRDSRSIDFIDCPLEDKIVRSKRLLEKRSRRRESKLKFMVEEAGIPKRLDLRKKKSEPYDPNDPLRLFLRGAETTRLLTAKEESVLVAAIQDLMRSEEVKSRLEAQFDREPTLVEWAAALGVSCRELKAQLHSGNSSREKLIHANFRLVVHIAKQYQGKGLSLQDLMQEGSTGLMRSVEKFKPQAGCRFASYAYWWIRQSVRRAIFHHSRTIRLPDNVYTLLYKVTEAKRLCIQDGNHQPTQEDIASRVGITVEKLDKLLFTARMPISMQQTIWSDQDTTFQEVTADSAVETPEMSVSKQLMRQHVRGLMSILSSKEKKIICLRFGIDEPESRSLSEVGAVFGLSKERVRQLESRALYKLKQTLCSQGLDAYADLLV